jgi:subtilisin family serine protease
LVYPLFSEVNGASCEIPTATPEKLATGVIACVEAGARVLNVSAAYVEPSSRAEDVVSDALDHAARRGAIVVAAAGNQGTVGTSAITRHPWVIPVVACDRWGRPMNQSNLGGSIGRRGLSAPGEGVTSLSVDGTIAGYAGTSVAAPFVTGAIALLWSEFPDASAAEVRHAIAPQARPNRAAIVPSLLDAWSAYQALSSTYGKR